MSEGWERLMAGWQLGSIWTPNLKTGVGSVCSTIQSIRKEEYKIAYASEDTEEMARIMALLDEEKDDNNK